MSCNVKLVLIDLDETLLRSDKTISDLTIKTLNSCQQNGIDVGFCTLRGQIGVKKYLTYFTPNVIVCNGGGVILYKEKLIHKVTFTKEETQILLNNAYKVIGPNCEITVDTDEGFYWNRKFNKSVKYAVRSEYNDMKSFGKAACKLCVQTQEENIAQQIASGVQNVDILPFSDIPWYKFSPKESVKENAVKFLMKHLDLSKNQIVAFGDDFSDIGMLQAAGYGIAMGNAIQPVKEIATDITLSNNEDGVATWLSNNILNIMKNK